MMKSTKKNGGACMCKKFLVHFLKGLKEGVHEVNCDNEFSARCICEGIHGEVKILRIDEIV